MNWFFVFSFASAVIIPYSSCVTHWIISVTSGRDPKGIIFLQLLWKKKQLSRWVKYNPVIQCKRPHMNLVVLLDTRAPHTNKKPMRTDFMCPMAQLLPKLDNFAYILAFFSLFCSLVKVESSKTHKMHRCQLKKNSIFWNSNKQDLVRVELFSHLALNK